MDVVVPALAGKTIPTRLDFEDGRKRLGEHKSLSSYLTVLFTKHILDRKRLRGENREAYGYFFAALEKVTISSPRRRAKHVV